MYTVQWCAQLVLITRTNLTCVCNSNKSVVYSCMWIFLGIRLSHKSKPEVSAALGESKHYCVLCSSLFQQLYIRTVQNDICMIDTSVGEEEFGLRLPCPLSSKFFQCRPLLVPMRQRPSETSGGPLPLWGLDVVLLQHLHNWADMSTAHHGALDDMANTPQLTQSWHTWGAIKTTVANNVQGEYIYIYIYW